MGASGAEIEDELSVKSSEANSYEGLPEKTDSGAGKGGEGRGRHWIAWAILLRRVFECEVLVCPRCGGRSRLIAAVDGGSQGEVVVAILSATAGSRGPAKACC